MHGSKLNLERAAITADDGWEKNPEGSDWKDKTWCVPLALAALLIAYVEDECDGPKGLQGRIDAGARELVKHPEDAMKSNEMTWLSAYQRMLELYNWWTVERPRLEAQESKLLNVWFASKTGGKEPEGKEDWERTLNASDKPEVRDLFNAHSNLERRIRAEVQEFCHGVVDIREYLWT